MCVSPLSVSTSWSGFFFFFPDFGYLGREPLLERACYFDLVGEKGRAPFAEGAPLWKRALSKCHIENLIY